MQLTPGERRAMQVAITYSPSTAARAQRMQEWLAPGGGMWCPVVLPTVHPDSFKMTAGPGYTHVHYRINSSSFEHVFKTPSNHVRELEGHKVASAYVHLRALRCFVQNCHPCMVGKKWILVAEDDVAPSTPKGTWASLPWLLRGTLNYLIASHRKGINKVHFVTEPQRRGGSMRCSNWTQPFARPALRSLAARHIKDFSVWLGSCSKFIDAKAYLIRRDQAARVLAAHEAIISSKMRVPECEDPWHAADQSCGVDPSMFNHNFGRCRSDSKSCIGRSLFLGDVAGPTAKEPTHERKLLLHKNFNRFTNYSQFSVYAEKCGGGVSKTGHQAMDDRGCLRVREARRALQKMPRSGPSPAPTRRSGLAVPPIRDRQARGVNDEKKA